jgi:hypothetical protein
VHDDDRVFDLALLRLDDRPDSRRPELIAVAGQSRIENSTGLLV